MLLHHLFLSQPAVGFAQNLLFLNNGDHTKPPHGTHATSCYRHRGGLHSAESLLYLIHHIKNINGNLKPGSAFFCF